jgi:hypothetical protein
LIGQLAHAIRIVREEIARRRHRLSIACANRRSSRVTCSQV